MIRAARVVILLAVLAIAGSAFAVNPPFTWDEPVPQSSTLPTPVLSAAPEFLPPWKVSAPELTSYADPSAGLTIDTSQREAVRVFYKGLYSKADNIPMDWSGDHSSCNAGTTGQLYQNAVALRINWFRAMAGVPANVSLYGPYSQQNQQAGLVMSSNNSLSHTPPNTWNCWTQTAYDAANKSNLALGQSGAAAVTGYMLDSGTNNAGVGHRRWVLHPPTQNMGTGDVSTGTYNGVRSPPANALWVIDSHIWDARPPVRDDFVAWPPKGYVPYPLVFGRWSLGHSSADFSNAVVTVAKNGANIPVSQEVVRNGTGENTLVWLLQGTNDSTVWSRPVSDEAYMVTVSNVLLGGVLKTFSYTVIVFDHDTVTPGAAQTTLNVASNASVNTAFSASVEPMTNATAYEAALYRLNVIAGTLTPPVAGSDWSYVTGPNGAYNPVEANTFHLYHADFASQTLTLNKKLSLMATSNSPTFGQSNSPRQDG